MLRIILLSTAAALATGFDASAQTQAQTKTTESRASKDIPAAPAEGGPRRWQINANHMLSLRAAPSSNSTELASYDDDVVLSNLGCHSSENDVWCLVKSIHAKQRGYVLANHLQPAVAPDGTRPQGTNDSVLRARKSRFDAHGEIACAQERGEPMGQCDVSVARSDGSDATVVASFSNGFKRTLYFVHGEFISANATMSGSGSDTDWEKQGDLHLIRIDDQRYQLYDELIFGR